MEELTRLQPLFDAIIAAGGRPFVVGGFVRDHLLSIPSKDIDIEVHGLEPDQLSDALGHLWSTRAHDFPFRMDEVGKSFGVTKLTFVKLGLDVDVSLPRTERKVGAGHQDFAVSVEPWIGIEKALARRDFTINAMAFDMTHAGKLVDPFDGWDDLKNGRLVAVGPAFSEDPLRVLRGVQFAARFGFAFEKQTAILCEKLVPELLSEISEERLWIEWEKIGSKGQHFKALEQALKAVGLGTVFGDIKACEMNLHGLSPERRVPIVLAGIGFMHASIDAVPNHVRDVIRDINMARALWDGSDVGSRMIARNQLKHATWLDVTRIDPDIRPHPWVLEGPIPLPVNGDDLLTHTGGKPGKWVGDALKMIADLVDDNPSFSRFQALNVGQVFWEESLK